MTGSALGEPVTVDDLAGSCPPGVPLFVAGSAGNRGAGGHTPGVSTTAAPPQPRPPAGAAAERRTTSVELLWDLVFVFAVTQVTTLLYRHLTWSGCGRGLLVLALVWWAWSAFVWAANAQEETARSLRMYLLVACAFIFISGLAVPDAFGSTSVLFAGTYAVVRLLHLGLYADASRRGHAAWSAIWGFAITVGIGMTLLVIGSLVGDGARVVLWAAAVLIDYSGPAWLTRERLRGIQRVAVAHFADRYGLFVLICLGESIVAIGVGAGSLHLHVTAALIAVAGLGLVATAALWWTYFDRLSGRGESSLRDHEDPVLAAADAYSYLHLVIVAGVILFAAGVRLLVHSPMTAPPASVRLALCAGVSAYLVGCTLFAARLGVTLSYLKPLAALAVLALFAVGGGLPAWLLMSVLAAVLVGLCAAETLVEARAAERAEDSPAALVAEDPPAAVSAPAAGKR